MVDKHTVTQDGMKYSFTLRDGLKLHDGQPVVAEDCVESLKRWMKKDRFGRLLAAHTAKMAPVDRKTFTLELGEQFGPVLEALGKPSSNVPFMMPARIAATSADEQIKEIVGSGPFRFVKDEWQPGNQVVYVRTPTTCPRNEAPSGSAGGKQVLPRQGRLALHPRRRHGGGRAGGGRGRLVGDPAARLRPEDRAERRRWRRS